MSTITLSSRMSNEEISVPEEYVCPISLSVMKDPVMSKDGKNFEKRAIMDWLNRGHVNCPLTRQPLKPSLLVPNANLKMNIQQWRKENNVSDVDENEHSCSAEENEVDFVGLLQIDQPASAGASNTNVDEDEDASSSRRETQPNPVDDDLKDLMDLYNEVLELTSAPYPSLPPARPQRQPSNVLPAPTQAETDAAIGAIVAQTARRNWRPNFFAKKKSSTS